MSATYEIEIVFMQKLGNDFRSKSEGNATIVLSPAANILQKKTLYAQR